MMPKSHSKSGWWLQPTAQPTGQPWAILTGSFPFRILLLPQTPFHRLLLESKTGRSFSLSQPNGKRREHRDGGKNKTTQPLAQVGSNQNFSPRQTLLPLPWLGWGIERGGANRAPEWEASLCTVLWREHLHPSNPHPVLQVNTLGSPGRGGGERNVDSSGLVM